MEKMGTGRPDFMSKLNNVILEISSECNELPGPTETNASEDYSAQLMCSFKHLLNSPHSRFYMVSAAAFCQFYLTGDLFLFLSFIPSQSILT